MTDDATDAIVDATEEEETAEVEETEVDTTDEVEDEPLGDAGKKALAAERANVRAAKKESREIRAELAALKAQLEAKDKPADEQELDRVRREAATEATARANARILRSEIKAAAAGKFADPADAIAFLNLDDFDVDENGDVDAEAIEDAISDLLTRKPHLSAGKKKFGDVNQSPKAPAQPAQLTLAEYNSLSRDERRKAREAGRVKNIIGAN